MNIEEDVLVGLKKVYENLNILPPEALIIQIPHNYDTPAQIKKDILSFFAFLNDIGITFTNQPKGMDIIDYIFKRNVQYHNTSIVEDFETVLFKYNTGLVIYIEKREGRNNYTLMWDEGLEDYDMDDDKIYTVITLKQFLQRYLNQKFKANEIKIKRRKL